MQVDDSNLTGIRKPDGHKFFCLVKRTDSKSESIAAPTVSNFADFILFPFKVTAFGFVGVGISIRQFLISGLNPTDFLDEILKVIAPAIVA